MPAPVLAIAGAKIAAGLIRKVKGKTRGARARAPGRARVKRIVFSERQWEFVRSLMSMTAGVRTPAFPRARRRRRRPFGR